MSRRSRAGGFRSRRCCWLWGDGLTHAARRRRRSPRLEPSRLGAALFALIPIGPLLAGGLLLAAVAVARGDPESAPDHVRYQRELDAARAESAAGTRRQLALARWRLGFAIAALGLAVHGLASSRREGRTTPRALRLRRTALGLLALASVASYYRFSFTDRIRFGMHVKDVYHYYVGSKYFAEIGYGGIYECTLAAAVESELFWVDELTQVRDLRTMQQAPARAMVERGVRECRPRFTPSRWHDFRRDLGFFFERLDGPVWQRTLLDHGYNPSPVWTLLATPVASAAPASGLPVLVHIDSLLVAGAFVAVGWAFGFEAMCLAAIVWGTGFPWRYTWLGDSFLRQLWFVSALVGVCCLRKGRAYAAGALFAVSALVRLFPAVLLAGCGLHALQRAIRERAWPAEALRVAVGAGVASLVLIGGTLVTTERGLDDYAAFHHNTSVYRDIVGANLAGLPALLWRIDGTATLQWDQDFAPASARWIHPRMSLVIRIAAALALLFLFLRASREARGWEAAAASFAFIPVLASPAGYYLEFVVLGVPLALRWPWVGVWLLSACALWLVNGLHWRPLRDQYTVVSLVAVALSFAVMATLQRRPRAVAPGSGAGARDDANRDRPAAEVQDARAIGSNSENPST